MTDIEKLKSDDLFANALRVARELLPETKFYAIPRSDTVADTVYLLIPDAVDEDCEKIGSSVYPGYDQESAENLYLPLCVGTIPSTATDGLLDVTNLEV